MVVQSVTARGAGWFFRVRRKGIVEAATAAQNPPAVPPAQAATPSRSSAARPRRPSPAGFPPPEHEQETRDAVETEVGERVRPGEGGGELRVRDRRQREGEEHPPRQHREIQPLA